MWAIHSQPVFPKPHKKNNSSWIAIQKVLIYKLTAISMFFSHQTSWYRDLLNWLNLSINLCFYIAVSLPSLGCLLYWCFIFIFFCLDFLDYCPRKNWPKSFQSYKAIGLWWYWKVLAIVVFYFKAECSSLLMPLFFLFLFFFLFINIGLLIHVLENRCLWML